MPRSNASEREAMQNPRPALKKTNSNLQRRLRDMHGTQRFLTVYSALLTTALALLLLTGATTKKSVDFDELNVHRINVREPDGTLRMVISNHARLPGIITRGKEQKFERPQAVMIFYNDEGSENGGLIFGGRVNAKGEVVDSGGSLSFDKYGTNQIVQLIGVDDKDDRFAGLVVTDSPSGTEVHRRVWVGREDDGTARVSLMDAKGKKRIVMQVSADCAASLSFLDADGKVVSQVLPTQTARTTR